MATKEIMKKLFKGKSLKKEANGAITSKDQRLESVEINYSEFDAASISSVFNYVILKFGSSICNEPDRLKNVLSDLAPALSREIKLLHYLCKCRILNKMLEASDKDESELLLWVNQAISYLAKEEMIDEQLAYEFCIGLIRDMKGKDVTDDYSQKKEQEAREAEIQGLLSHARILIEEENYVNAEENLYMVCEKAMNQEAAEEAKALLETAAERQLENLVNSITEEINGENYKAASDKLETAKEMACRCRDDKKIKNLTRQLTKSEEKIGEMIQKCLKNVDKAIKKKEYDKAEIYINQAKDMAGNNFPIEKICSFEEQRILIEKLIDSREFETAVSNINALHQSFGLEKEFTRQIVSLERKINRYQLSLVVLKGLLFVLFIAVIVLTNIKDLVPVKEKIIYVACAIWGILHAFIVKKSTRRKILCYKTLLLGFDYTVWLLAMYFLKTRLELNHMIMFALILPAVCGGFLISTMKSEKNGRILLGNVAIAAGSIIAAILIC